jgi:hypothetical protein
LSGHKCVDGILGCNIEPFLITAKSFANEYARRDPRDQLEYGIFQGNTLPLCGFEVRSTIVPTVRVVLTGMVSNDIMES